MEQATYKGTKSIYEHFETMIPFGFHRCKVLKVYDGDTIWVALEVANIGLVRIKLRFDIIDTPEIRGGTDESKVEAQRSKQFVCDLILGKMITVYIDRIDPYYRYLAMIYPDKKDWIEYLNKPTDTYYNLCNAIGNYEGNLELNNYMILVGLAKEYKGAK